MFPHDKAPAVTLPAIQTFLLIDLPNICRSDLPLTLLRCTAYKCVLNSITRIGCLLDFSPIPLKKQIILAPWRGPHTEPEGLKSRTFRLPGSPPKTHASTVKGKLQVEVPILQEERDDPLQVPHEETVLGIRRAGHACGY